MHPYGSDDSGRGRVPVFLMFLAAGLAYATSEVVAALGTAPWWLEIPSVIGWYGTIWWAFDHWVWHTGFARAVGLSSTPDLRGEWAAEIVSSHDGHEKRHDAKVEIAQTWSKMSFLLQTATSRSMSCAGSIAKDGPEYTLLYYYRNQPSGAARESMQTHAGAGELNIHTDDHMSGPYFTGRGRQTAGQLELRRSGGSAAE